MPEFDSVGVEGLNIQSIIPDATTLESYPAGKIYIQTFTDMAAKDEMFWYFTAEESDEGEVAGWYSDINGITLAEKTFVKGEGFMLYMPREDGKLNVSGEVSLDEKTIEFRQKFTLTGNFRPISVGIQDLLVPSDTVLASYPAGKVYLQTFTDMAAKDEMFWYFTAEESDEGEVAGWYADINGITIAEKTFAPGQGFMLYMPTNGDVTFKAINLSK